MLRGHKVTAINEQNRGGHLFEEHTVKNGLLADKQLQSPKIRSKTEIVAISCICTVHWSLVGKLLKGEFELIVRTGSLQPWGNRPH